MFSTGIACITYLHQIVSALKGKRKVFHYLVSGILNYNAIRINVTISAGLKSDFSGIKTQSKQSYDKQYLALMVIPLKFLELAKDPHHKFLIKRLCV